MPGIDFLLQWALFAVFFPVFIADAISHVFQLIDGPNGLAGFTGLAGSLSLATIAHQVGLTEHQDILLIIGAAITCAFLGLYSLRPIGLVYCWLQNYVGKFIPLIIHEKLRVHTNRHFKLKTIRQEAGRSVPREGGGTAAGNRRSSPLKHGT